MANNSYRKNGKEISIEYFKTKYGELILGAFESRICLCDWRYRKLRPAIDNRIQAALEASYVERHEGVIEQCKKELEEYFTARRQVFTVPILMLGSEFQRQVWEALLGLEYGTTCSYQEIALKIKSQKAVRAVGSANGANSIAIVIPCHRVIAKDATLGGYAGGLNTKKKLLKLEKDSVCQAKLFSLSD